MKKILFVAAMLVLLTCAFGQVMARNIPMPSAKPASAAMEEKPKDSAFVFKTKPDLQWTDGNLQITADNKTYKVNQKFPSKTNTQITKSGTGYTVSLLTPGSSDLLPVTKDMVSEVAGSTEKPAAKVNNATLKKPAGVLPTTDLLPPPFAVIPHYPTGKPTVDPVRIPQQKEAVEKILKHLNTTNDFVFFIGTASYFDDYSCVYSPGYTYFSELSEYEKDPRRPSNVIKKVGKQACDQALGIARSVHAGMYFTAKGIDIHRVIPLRYSAWGINPGSNFENQSVVAFMVGPERVTVTKFPKEAGLIPIPEQSCPTCEKSEKPEITYNIPPNCGVSQRKEGNDYIVTMVCVSPEVTNGGTQPQPPPTEDKGFCHNHLRACIYPPFILGSAGIGVLLSQFNVTAEGGSGSNGGGPGGDAHVSMCGDSDWICIAGGVGVGIISAEITYQIVKHHKNTKVSVEPIVGGARVRW